MREQHALRRSGGAGRVLNVDDIFGADVLLGIRSTLAQHRRPRIGPEQDDVAERHLRFLSRARFVQDLQVVAARVLLLQEDRFHARLTQDVAQFVRAVGGVDVYQDHADEGGGKLQVDPFGAVGRPDADAVAGPQPQSPQAAGCPFGAFLELGVRDAQALVTRDHGHAGGVAGGRFRQHPGRWSSP